MPEKKDQSKLLKEIRDNYTYFDDAWRPIRDEAKKDMKYVSGDPWDPNDREFRRKHDRPVMTWDELSPYIDRLVNSPRQNKRAIKINPKGAGATDKTAELRENHIRAIQYDSRAQSAFTTAFQGAAERSYGYFGINARLVATNLTDEQLNELSQKDPAKLFEQELYIYRIPNPDSVLFNPNYKEQDCSDSTECFVQDVLSRAEFKRNYPRAEFGDWAGDYADTAPGWQHEKEVRVAAYWKVQVRKRKLLLLTGGKDENDYNAMYEDELPKGWSEAKDAQTGKANSERIKRDRSIETRTVKQYTTNGLEILDESGEVPIPWIPIIPVFGKEMWVDEGSGSKRRLISLVRLARDPFMFYCYARSQQAEEFGMTPRAPFIGYTGQFESFRDEWATANKIPRAYLQVDPTTDPTNPAQLLPLPTRPQFTPNAEAYEVACEAARRAIQTAMGGSNLPYAAQRKNEKSGVALDRINEAEDRGTFHFIDNYNFSLEHAGRILNSWYPFVYDTKRDVAIREADESYRTVRINDEQHQEPGPNGEAIQAHYDAVTGDHGVTVTVGPDSNSQRDDANEFAQNLVQELQAIAGIVPPGAAAKLLALAIRLRQLGPLGDEMADTIDPPEEQAKQGQALAQAQQAAQQANLVIAELKAENEKLKLERAGKVIDNTFKDQRESANRVSDEHLAQLDRDIQVLKALLASKQNISDQEYETFRTVWTENHGAAHEVAMQKDQQVHQQNLAASAAANAQQSQQSDQQHQAAMAESSASSGAVNPGQGA